LPFPQPFHQHGVVGGLYARPALGVVADGIQAVLAGSLHLIEAGIGGDAEPFIRAGAIAGTPGRAGG
jgi:hypothetical protein